MLSTVTRVFIWISYYISSTWVQTDKRKYAINVSSTPSLRSKNIFQNVRICIVSFCISHTLSRVYGVILRTFTFLHIWPQVQWNLLVWENHGSNDQCQQQARTDQLVFIVWHADNDSCNITSEEAFIKHALALGFQNVELEMNEKSWITTSGAIQCFSRL